MPPAGPASQCGAILVLDMAAPSPTEVLAEVGRALATDGRLVLCTIVRCSGSTPGKPGWRLALLRDGACFVNTARGEIVEEAALVAELVSGRIRAGLDVFVDEPNVPAELLDLPNVVLTPHLGSATRQAREAMTRLVVDNLLAVERGDPPLTPVAPLA